MPHDRQQGRDVTPSAVATRALSLLGIALTASAMGGCCQGSSAFDASAQQAAAIAGLIAAGGEHTCAVLPDGQVACWGDDQAGQLGIRPSCQRTVGSSTTKCYGEERRNTLGSRKAPRRTPMTVLTITDAVAVVAGTKNTLTLHRDGTLRSWGQAQQGPFRPVAGAKGIAAISASARKGCALFSKGQAKCWQMNGFGTTPWPALRKRPIAVAAGDRRHCAVSADGTVGCWEHSEIFGAEGRQELVSGVEDAYFVASGGEHFCALTRTGVACWGANERGQLGDGTTTSRDTAVAIQGVAGARQVAAGRHHSCAVHDAGLVSCWGSNESGQLGNGGGPDVRYPVQVVGIAGAVAVTAGGAHSCALLADGLVKCWGGNERGQLGVGETTAIRRALSPVTVCASGRWDDGQCVGGEPLRAAIPAPAHLENALLRSPDR